MKLCTNVIMWVGSQSYEGRILSFVASSHDGDDTGGVGRVHCAVESHRSATTCCCSYVSPVLRLIYI